MKYIMTMLLLCLTVVGQTQDLEKTIRQYILDHPEVLVQSLQNAATQKSRTIQNNITDENIAMITKMAFKTPDFSDKKKPVVIEFFDYQCGYCKSMYSVLSRLEKLNEITVLRMELPVLGENSVKATKAAFAASRQGKYQELHHAFMELNRAIDEKSIDEEAGKIGLDLAKLHDDMSSHAANDFVEKMTKQARELGVDATPALIVGKEVFIGMLPENDLKKKVGI